MSPITRTALINFLRLMDGDCKFIEETHNLSEKEWETNDKIVHDFLNGTSIFDKIKSCQNFFVEGTGICVSFKRNQKEPLTKKIIATEWKVCFPNGKDYAFYDDNARIKNAILSSIRSIRRNCHNEYTEPVDWLAAIAFFYYLIDCEDSARLKFVSFLASKYDLIIPNDDEILLKAIHDIIVWKGDDFRKKRNDLIQSSLPLLIQVEKARKESFSWEGPQSIALFSNKLDDFSIRSETKKLIEEIENDIALSSFEKTFDKVLEERSKQEKNLIKKSILDGVTIAHKKNFQQNSDSPQNELINPDVEVFLYEIIKNVAAYSVMEKEYREKYTGILCSYASDFSTSRRRIQEQAILTLAYILFERFELPKEKRQEIFIVSYGKNTYSQMDQLFSSMDAQASGYYKKLIVDKYNQVIAKEISQREDPIYFFYYHYAAENGDEFVYHCYRFRVKTREQKSDNVNALLSEAKDIIFSERFKNWEDSKKYLYAMQAVFYGLSNIAMISDTARDQVLELITTTQDLLARVIVVDYLTRLSVFGKFKGDDLTRFINSPQKFFMLCGPTRLICSLIKGINGTQQISIKDIFSENKYGINEHDFTSSYCDWLTREKGRYKILLAKLLSVIKDFNFINADTKKHCLSNCKFFNESDFLNYDNVSALEVNKWIIEIKEKYTS